jgi:hypothetical protein
VFVIKKRNKNFKIDPENKESQYLLKNLKDKIKIIFPKIIKGIINGRAIIPKAKEITLGRKHKRIDEPKPKVKKEIIKEALTIVPVIN